MTVPKVAICTPFYRTWEGWTGLAAMMMGFATGGQVAALPIATSGCYVEDNRNGCVEHAIATGVEFDWLLWMDSDMEFPPDALLRLLAHDKDIVGANYRQRTPPFNAVGVYLDGSDTHFLEPGLHAMAQLPTGLLLTRWKIYQKMGYPWFPSGLRGQMRDDVAFCHQARRLGYEIWCDHDLTFQVVHNDNGNRIPWFRPDQLIDGRATVASPERQFGRQETGAIIDLAKSAEDGAQRAKQAGEQWQKTIAAE